MKVADKSVFIVIGVAGVEGRGDTDSTMGATHVTLLYERENVIQCSVHGTLPRPFGNLFSLLLGVSTHRRNVPSFRGPGVRLWALFKSCACLHATLKQMLGSLT